MVRRTSREAYEKILREGLLPNRRMQVYEWLYERGPATAREVERAFILDGNHHGRHVNKRLPELREQGVVEELGERQCAVTGENAILWDVTDALPVPFRGNGVRRSPEYFYVSACDDCLPLQDYADDEPNMCWMDPKVEQAEEGYQPDNCPLLERDFVVRAERRRR